MRNAPWVPQSVLLLRGGLAAGLLFIAACSRTATPDTTLIRETISIEDSGEALEPVATEPIVEVAPPAEAPAEAPAAVDIAPDIAALPDEPEPVTGAPVDPNRTCTYRTYEWSTTARRGVNHREVVTTYGELADDERDPADLRCTVCRQDQALLDPAAFGIEGVEAVYVCAVWRDAIAAALLEAVNAGFEIRELDGYRVGRTRGRIVDGLRTELSNHSYGAAIDINADHNGLYGDCNVSEVTSDTIENCDLRVGGAWDPDARPATTIVRGGALYRAFVETLGWRWGGSIAGSTRDMMHFSPSGF